MTTESAFKFDAELFFLESGHYLFRSFVDGVRTSKFVTARDVAAAFTQQESDSGYIPSGVVRVGANAGGPFFVYSAPRQKVTITLPRPDDGDASEATIPIPRTVLLGHGDNYYLWALRDDHFSINYDAYRAPFPNVYETGRICWGGNRVENADATRARVIWEMFFKTPFNNDLANGKSTQSPNNVCTLLYGLNAANKYPVSDLVPTHSDIKTLIDRILENRNG